MTTYRFGSAQLTKWQLALLIGAPFAIGMGIYAYRQAFPCDKHANDKEKADKKKKDAAKAAAAAANSKPGTKNAVEDAKAAKHLTVLQEATELKNHGNTCYRNGKYDEAINFYDLAIEKCPRDNPMDLAIFHQNRAAAYEMLKKWSAVKDDCMRSLEYNPRYAKAYTRRAKAYEATGDYQKCVDDATAACILESFSNTNTVMFADRVLKLAGKEAYEAYIPTHKRILPSKHFVRTYFQTFVDDPIQKMPMPQAVLSEPLRGFLRAKMALKEERYDDVVPACTEEIETSEAESQYKSEALLLRGTFNLIISSLDEAAQDFDAVINNENADVNLRVNALIKRGSLHFQNEKKDEAFADFERAVKLKPNCPDVYHQRGQIYLILEELERAVCDFNEAIALEPDNVMALVQKTYAEYRMAMLQQDQNRLFLVMNEFKNLIEKYPDCSDCYCLLGQVMTDQMQYQQADEVYQKAMKLSPENAVVYVHRSILFLQWTADVEQAISILNQALQVDDKCALALETLGTIEVQRANLSRAIELFAEALKYAKSKPEMMNLFSLRLAAQAQLNVVNKLQSIVPEVAAAMQMAINGGSGTAVAQ